MNEKINLVLEAVLPPDKLLFYMSSYYYESKNLMSMEGQTDYSPLTFLGKPNIQGVFLQEDSVMGLL